MPPSLVLRREVCEFEQGPRPLTPVRGPLRAARFPLLQASSYMCARTPAMVVALTYDDGPDPVQTPVILDRLAAAGAKATFFVLTRQAREYPQVLRRIVDEGHEVGLHGIDHARLTAVPAREAVRGIRAGRDELQDLLGSAVTSYRPTYGAQTPAMYLAARSLGMDVVIWSAWARDWFDDDVRTVADRAIGAVHPGAVLLLHDCTDDTDETELPRPRYSRGELTGRILDGLTADGYAFVTAGELKRRHPQVRSVWIDRLRHG